MCQLRTDELVPASKYWTYWSHAGVYGTNKPSSWLPIDACLYPYYFIGWLRRETGYGPVDRLAGALWIMSGALIFESSGPAQRCWWFCKRLLCVDRVRYAWSITICGLIMECVWRVGRVFSCRVYIDLNRRNSRIWVTACSWQSSRSK
jgi:hypothetical protein